MENIVFYGTVDNIRKFVDNYNERAAEMIISTDQHFVTITPEDQYDSDGLHRFAVKCDIWEIIRMMTPDEINEEYGYVWDEKQLLQLLFDYGNKVAADYTGSVEWYPIDENGKEIITLLSIRHLVAEWNRHFSDVLPSTYDETVDGPIICDTLEKMQFAYSFSNYISNLFKEPEEHIVEEKEIVEEIVEEKKIEIPDTYAIFRSRDLTSWTVGSHKEVTPMGYANTLEEFDKYVAGEYPTAIRMETTSERGSGKYFFQSAHYNIFYHTLKHISKRKF